ncbi:uncharacterized protein LOC128220031 isoform X2 [Mya arenaria]|uniref:uncharacterized protein LOC128220031 isoform X2 n=1 Tax=Mya arenaria TaxID=6604 RepID=UPI0022E3D9FA|nr:uncharacterized protein LOC128220031 isoform X2 [Mya arenaria]
MMSDRGYPGREDWHRRGSQEVGQRKIAELQRQIASMEIDMRERADLVHKLNRLQQIEEDKRIVEDKVLERNSRNNSRNSSRNGTPRLLKSEMERLYGRDSHLDGGGSPVDRQVLETVIKHRTKEFSQKQQETALKAKFLDKERQRLQEARRHVEEQRQALLAAQSPTGRAAAVKSIQRKAKPVQGVDSYIKSTVTQLPGTIDKIFKMRDNLQHHYNYYKKPYNGELDLGSYQPWQIQDYFLCRGIVDDVVENFLNLYFLHDDVVESGTYKAILAEDKVWRDRQTESIAEKRAVHLIAEELILNETGDMIDEVIGEMYHMYRSFGNITDGMLMAEAEYAASGQSEPRDPSDRAYNMVTKGYYSIKENRNSHRDDIWGHSQYAMNKVKKRKITRKAGGEEVVEEVEADEEEEEEDVDAPDLTILDFNTIPTVQPRSLEPSLLDPAELLHEKEAFRRYSRRELNYWKKMVPTVHEHTFDKKSRGLRLVQTSPNHRFIAATTFHGDIMVYDLSVEPWRPFRVLTYDDKKDNPVTDISWSLDGTRFTAINSLGRLQVISVVSGQVDFGPGQKLGLPIDDKGIYPQQMQVLLTLDTRRHDFIFKQGPLAEEGVQDDDELAPQKAAFFPSLSFLGTQNDVMVSLDNGDILKCNIQDAVKSINPEHLAVDNDCPRIYRPLLSIQEEATDVNAIGRDVEAELLRAHKKSIVYMCFVESLGTMITVDQRGFIYKWKYNIKFKASFGWYIPSRKFKLETSKIMYKESEKDKPKVVFTDQTAPGKKPRTRQEIAAQRKRVQNTLENMQLGEPWHQEDLDEEDMLMQIFAPRGVIAETGAMFHIVYRDLETDKLSTYVTRLYKPVKVRCTRVVHVSGSPTSTDLVVVLLFNAYPPKGPHFTIFIVDIRTMELRDIRVELPITPEEYNMMMTKTLLSCDLTRVMGSTGTEYLFIVFNGRVRAISLLTGQTVARTGLTKDENANDDEDEEEEEDDKPIEFPGCIVDENLLFYPPDAECKVACLDGRMHCILYGRKMSKMYIITFVDKNKYSERRAMYKTYTTLPKPRKVPVDLRLNTHQWQLDDIQHPAVAARRMILRKIDVEMRKAGLIRDHPKLIKRIAMSDKISQSGILDKEAIMQRRAASRADTATPPVDDDDKF